MDKIKSTQQLRELKEKSYSNTALRTIAENPDRVVFLVSMDTAGIEAGAKNTMLAIIDELNIQQIGNASVIAGHCSNAGSEGPVIEVNIPGNASLRYTNVAEALGKEIVNKHISNGDLSKNSFCAKEPGSHE